jgi:hypothetical protein
MELPRPRREADSRIGSEATIFSSKFLAIFVELKEIGVLAWIRIRHSHGPSQSSGRSRRHGVPSMR